MPGLIFALATLTGLLCGLGLRDLDRAWTSRDVIRRAAESLMESPERTIKRLRVNPTMATLIDLCRPLAVSFVSADGKRNIQRELDFAGHPLGFDVESFLGFRLLLTVSGALAGWYIGNLIYMVIGAATTYFLAMQWLTGQSAERQAQIRMDLPDFLDAVAISLSAGAPVDTALREVTDRFDGPLREEMEELNAQIYLGVPRQQAFRQLLERTRCRELEVVVLALVHGLQLGVPMAQTLEDQARAMRHSRSQRARQLAAAATPKITLVSTLLVTPSVLLLIMGLLVINFYFNDNLYGFRDVFGNQ